MSRGGQQHVVNGRIVGWCPAVMTTMWLHHATPPSPLKTTLLDDLIGLARSGVVTLQEGR